MLICPNAIAGKVEVAFDQVQTQRKYLLLGDRLPSDRAIADHSQLTLDSGSGIERDGHGH